MNTNLIVQFALSIPKTVYFNLRVFPIKQALKMPVFVNYRVRIVGHLQKGFISVTNVTTGMLKVGFPYLNYPTMHTILKVGGNIFLDKKATIQDGCEINVGGVLKLGNNFRCNRGTKIDAKKEVVFGDNVLIAPNCYISDSDGHHILFVSENQIVNEDKKISVGNHVWIGRGSYILKGASIGNDCVIGAASVVNREFVQNNVIIAGIPGKVVKEKCNWQQ